MAGNFGDYLEMSLQSFREKVKGDPVDSEVLEVGMSIMDFCTDFLVLLLVCICRSICVYDLHLLFILYRNFMIFCTVDDCLLVMFIRFRVCG